MKTFLLVAVLVGLPMQAHAAFVDGNKLVNLMREMEKAEAGQPGWNQVDFGVYRGYVGAATDVYADTGVICPLSGIRSEQVEAIVAAYLKANPQRWHEPAIYLVRDALKEAFPCG